MQYPRTQYGPRPFQIRTSAAAQEWALQKEGDTYTVDVIERLMKLVALEEVKEQFLAIKSKVEIFNQQNISLRGERFNIIFQGNPGTGAYQCSLRRWRVSQQ